MNEVLQGKVEGKAGGLVVSVHVTRGKVAVFPQVKLSMREGCGQALAISSYVVVAGHKAVASYRCHHVKTFSFSAVVAAKFPELTFTRECCQESYLIPKLKVITS